MPNAVVKSFWVFVVERFVLCLEHSKGVTAQVMVAGSL